MEDLIDLEALRTSAAEFLAVECDRETVLHHVARNSGPLHSLWEKVSELGWLMLSIPEEDGGLGLGTAALIPIYEELGRRAAPLPYLPTTLAIDCIVRGASDEQKALWLPAIASGAVASIGGLGTSDLPRIRISQGENEATLDGTARDLLDADAADFIVLLCRDDKGGLHRVMIENNAGLPLATQKLWDHGHTLSTLRLENVQLPAGRAFPVTQEDEDALLAHSALGLAAEGVGGSEGVLEMTVEYMKTREQFGKPIGSFQALKHRVADHQTETVAARHLVEAANAMLASNNPDWKREASAAKALACQVFADVARDCIQLHGGIGFTAEQACHLYLKRADLNRLLFGSEATHLAIATSHLLATGTAR